MAVGKVLLQEASATHETLLIVARLLLRVPIAEVRQGCRYPAPRIRWNPVQSKMTELYLLKELMPRTPDAFAVVTRLVSKRGCGDKF